MPAPELAQQVNVQVALSDGTVLDNPVGVPLPDGATITVGEGGYALIGGTELHPGDVAIIQQGRIQVERQPAGRRLGHGLAILPPEPDEAAGHAAPHVAARRRHPFADRDAAPRRAARA